LRIRERGRIHNSTCLILELIVNVMGARLTIDGLHAGIAHRTDQLACGYRLANTNVLGLRMKYLVQESVLISDRDLGNGTTSRVLHHAIHWRSQGRILKIDPTLPVGANVTVKSTPPCGFDEPSGRLNLSP